MAAAKKSFVIEGEFADDHGSYPAGTYVRNPIGTSHAPSVGPLGCVIFVKLHQFDADDSKQFAVDTTDGKWIPSQADGVEIQPLHEFGTEQVALIRFAPDTTYPSHVHEGGEEILVLQGEIRDGEGVYPTGAWVRYPDASQTRSHELSGRCLALRESPATWLERRRVRVRMIDENKPQTIVEEGNNRGFFASLFHDLAKDALRFFIKAIIAFAIGTGCRRLSYAGITAFPWFSSVIGGVLVLALVLFFSFAHVLD